MELTIDYIRHITESQLLLDSSVSDAVDNIMDEIYTAARLGKTFISISKKSYEDTVLYNVLDILSMRGYKITFTKYLISISWK